MLDDRVAATLAGLANVTRPVVALSGGVDSTVLAALVARAHPGARAIHVNHHLRDDSERDAVVAAATAERLGLRFTLLSVDPDAIVEHAGGVESGARAVRYRALSAATTPDETLVTAHTADDHLETIALHLHSGTGASGLIGPRAEILIEDRRVVRPLLAWFRDEIVAWANAAELEWVEDPSNSDARFVRNRLRRDVIPVLRDALAREPLRRSLGRIAADAARLERLDRDRFEAALVARQIGRVELDSAIAGAARLDDCAAVLRLAAHDVGAARVSEARLFEAAARLVRGDRAWKLDGEGVRFDCDGGLLVIWRRHGRGA